MNRLPEIAPTGFEHSLDGSSAVTALPELYKMQASTVAFFGSETRTTSTRQNLATQNAFKDQKPPLGSPICY